MIFVAMVLALIALDIAALLWGADSREDFRNPEWRCRQDWAGFSRRSN